MTADPGASAASPVTAVSPYKLASVLLQYPTMALFDGIGHLEAVAGAPAAASREPFGAFLRWLAGHRRPPEAAQHYVETFDLRRRCALYLTYYRYGDTRKRGMAMLAFKAAYRAAGFEPTERRAARLPAAGAGLRRAAPRAARSCCAAHRADLELLRRALARRAPPTPVLSRRCARTCPAGPAGPGPDPPGMGERAAGRGGGAGAVRPPGIPDRAGSAAMTRRQRGGRCFLWAGLPYLALGIFVVGHIWRWRYDQFGWTSRSTQLQERRLLKWGSPALPLRHLRRDRRARHRRPHPRVLDPRDRHSRERLPLVLRGRRHPRRRPGHRRRRGAGRPAAARARGSGPPPAPSTTWR